MAILDWSRDYRRLVIAILVLGFVLRAIWAIVVPIAPISDSVAYDQLAWDLATRGSYEWINGDVTAYWPVGTSFIYSLLFRAFGHHCAPIAVLNVLVGTGTLALIISLAHEWASRGAAVCAGIIYAIWPSQIEFTSILASELLFNLLLLLAIYVVVVARFRSFVVTGALAGAFLAGAAYVRPTALALPLVLTAGLVWSRAVAWRRIATLTIAMFVTMAICIAPWTIRNERVFGTPAVISTNGAPVLWMGNNPQATGAYMPMPDDVMPLNETQRAAVLGSRATQFMSEHPGKAVALFLHKLVITHDRETIGVVWNMDSLAPAIGDRGVMILKALSTMYWWVVLLLGIAGIALTVRREGSGAILHPAILGWGYFAFVHALTLGADRYHFPSIPFIAILAGIAVESASARMREGRISRSTLSNSVAQSPVG